MEDDQDDSVTAGIIPRHRSPAFHKDEIKVLVDLIIEYKLLVLNKSNTTSACRAKELGWAKITQKFNNHGFKHARSIEGLKFKWKNLLKDVRRLSKNILDVNQGDLIFDDLTNQIVSLMYDEDINIGEVVLPSDFEEGMKDTKHQKLVNEDDTETWNENINKEVEDSSGDDRIVRNRSMNFSPQECRLLLQCVRAEKKFIFYKRNTKRALNIKNCAWSRITEQFNTQSPQKRSKKVLQTKFFNMKRIAKSSGLKRFFKTKTSRDLKHEQLLEENSSKTQDIKDEPVFETDDEPMNDDDRNNTDEQYESESHNVLDGEHRVDPDPLSTVLSSDSGLGTSMNIDSFNPFENKEVSKLKVELLKQKIENAKLEKKRIEDAMKAEAQVRESSAIERALRLRAARLEVMAAEIRLPAGHPALLFTAMEAPAQSYLTQYQT